jgi:hypothetical protein
MSGPAVEERADSEPLPVAAPLLRKGRKGETIRATLEFIWEIPREHQRRLA